MKNMKLRLSAALLAIVMCFGLFVGCGDSGLTVADVEKDPYAAVMDGNQKYMDALSSRYGDVFAVFDKIAEGTGTFAVDYAAPAADETADEYAAVLFEDIGLTAVVNSKNGAYSGKVTMGASGFTTDISLWGDKTNLALSAPAVLGEGTYGVKLDTIEADLANSELLTSLTGMTFEDLKTAMETEAGITWEDMKSLFSVDGWKTAFEKYMTDSEAIMKEITPVVAEETYKIGETEVPVISVQYTVDEAAAEKMNTAAVDMYESMFNKILTAAGMTMEDVMAEGGVDVSVSGAGTYKYYLNKGTGAIVAMDSDMGENTKATVVYSEDASKKFEMSADITVTVEGETSDVNVTVKEIAEEGKGGFDIDVTAAGEDGGNAKISIVRNDADGKFEAKATVDGVEMGSVAGTLTYSADELKLTLDSATSEGETTEIGLTMSAKAGGTVEVVPEYTNILTASAEELEGLMTIIGSMMYTPDYDDYYGDDYYDDYYQEEVNIGTGEEITFEDLCEGMTDEEIEQVLKDLEDLGMTTDDLVNMMY